MTRPLPVRIFGAILLGLPLGLQAQILNVPQTFQEQTEWCWAGVSSAVLAYYKKPMEQCEIANYTRLSATWRDFGDENCCTNPSGACNYWNYNYGYPGSIKDILLSKGIDNRGVSRSLSLQEVRTELAAQRPFIIRWGWKSSGGHFIVGHGIVDSTLYYMNPWPGEGSKIALYSWVFDNVDHFWTHTNILTTDPSTGASRDGARPIASSRARMSGNDLLVECALPASAKVDMRLHTLQGRLVRVVHEGFLPAGTHTLRASVSDLPAGAYLLSTSSDATRSTELVVR